MSDLRFVQADKIKNLQEMISRLEGDTFGPWLVFTTISGELHFSMGAWKKIDGFDNFNSLREFAEKLNESTKTVRLDFIRKLKQEIANECVKYAANEIKSQPNIKH